MTMPSLLSLHVLAGLVALLSGTAAMSFRKGSRRHRETGHVFVVSMLGLGATGAYIGFTRHEMLNGMMGVLTIYLVTTAWLTARRRDRQTFPFDYAAVLVPVAIGAGLTFYGFAAASTRTGSLHGYPAFAYFVFGSLALLFAAGDVRMLVRGGISGTPRMARHLGRMCFGLFIATASFFTRQSLFPAVLRTTHLLEVLTFLPLLLMVFWLIRVRRYSWSFGRESYRSAAPSMSLPSK
jgi:uncharacterized membrane protein